MRKMSVRLSVRPSVRPSVNRVNYDETKESSAYIFMTERLSSYSDTKKGW